jgi:RND superfamily putative drug exporter
MNRLWTRAAGPRAKWVIVGAWLVVALGLGTLQPRLQEATVNDQAAFLPADAESTQVLELLEERFASGSSIPALLVYRRAEGLTEADLATIRSDLAEVEGVADTAPAVSPLEPGAAEQGLVSADGTTALAVVPITAPTIDGIQAAVEELRLIAGGGSGLETYVTGPAGLSVDAVEVFGSIDGTLLVATTLLILTLLLAIYRSPAIAFVPLLVVALAYSVAAGLVYLLVTGTGLDVNGQTTGLLVILMFGAGTDYCLLIVSRYREELRRRRDKHEAMAEALTHTSPAILSSGGTVVAAMLVLLVAGFASTRASGPVLALGVAVTMLAGLTLLPALLTILGRRAFWPSVPQEGSERRDRGGFWRRIGDAVARRPRAIAAGTAAGLALAAAGLLVDLPGLSLAAGIRSETESVRGAEVLAEALPAGELAPAEVLVETEPANLDAAARAVAAALEADEAVAVVQPGERSEDGRIARLRAVLAADPYSDEAVESVAGLRETASAAAAEEGATALVGGPTAEEADTRETTRRDVALVVPLVLLVIFLILIALLRALVAPLYLIGTVILSFAATMGLAFAAFRFVFDSPGTDPSLVLFVFVFVSALGIDYNIFLMARVREEAARSDARTGVLVGLERTGGVITSAGLILAGTFLALLLLPLEQLFQLGFAVALGLLIDTFVVRTLLVPSVAFLLGDRSWWPWGLRVRE